MKGGEMCSLEVAEIRLEDLDTEAFIADREAALRDAVGDGLAVNALSGGVDSSTVTMLGHRALGDRLKTYFIDSGLMREGEPEYVRSVFESLGVGVEILDAQDAFFDALAGLDDPEDKRNAVTATFYKTVFGPLVRQTGASFLLHGTNYTDVEETVAGIKRQHNILAQLGIDPEEAYGYRVLEPLVKLRKSGVRAVARALGLPEELSNRPPFPGPALATRVIGEVTRERVATVRAATAIVEEELEDSGAFQYLAIVHQDRVTGIRDGHREFGQQIEIRCWESTDAVTATPTPLPFERLERLGQRIVSEVPDVVSVTYNITHKPPSTIEAV
jgi:GMP synthase (glutamine-hydrolysing)